MLINTDVHPEANVIYISAKILELVSRKKNTKDIDIMKLFKDYNKHYYMISFNLFLQALTSLFILKVIKNINEKGNICI